MVTGDEAAKFVAQVLLALALLAMLVGACVTELLHHL